MEARESCLIEVIRQKAFADMVTLKDYAAALGRSDRSLRNYVRQGLPVTYIGQSPYIVLSKAFEYWAARTRQKQEPRRPGRPLKAQHAA